MAYATPTEFLERYDVRDLEDLASDNNTAITDAKIKQDAKLLAALNSASGEIDAALLVANRYQPSELANLIGNSKYHLVQITCDIAMARMLMRRPGWNPEQAKSIRELADDALERLRNGENVFNLQPQKDAGNGNAVGLSAVEYSQSGLMRDRVRHYYPARPVRWGALGN